MTIQKRKRGTSIRSWPMLMIFAVCVGFTLGAANLAQTNVEKYQSLLQTHESVPGEVVVRFQKGVSSVLAMSAFQDFSIQAIKPFETNPEFAKIRLAKNEVAKFLSFANQNSNIQYAEPNYIYRISTVGEEPVEVIPNDPSMEQLWGLRNVGQEDSEGNAGIAGADIGATKAWATTTGNRNIVIAVIDTGVDYNHPDLAENIFINEGEFGDGKESNGIDDDGNGFIDDYRGWRFTSSASTNDPMDDNDHGTHVAGTIGARGDDGVGVTGVNWTTRILPIKFLSAAGGGTLEDAVKSVQYATLMSVNIMNNSWGGGGFSQALFDAITEAKDAGILFVAAAGNNSANNDTRPNYPAAYNVDNVFAVAANNNKDEMAYFTAYGKRTVHISAPGVRILSTLPGDKYGTFSGTSMACPHAAGAAALLWGTDESMTYLEVKERLIASRDPVPGMTRNILSSGRLNVYNAINEIFPPSNEPNEDAWQMGDAIELIESAHPYENNHEQEWIIEGPENAAYMRLHIAKAELEAGYDFLHLYNEAGQEVDKVSGNHPDGLNTWYVEGNYIRVVFKSDRSVTRWGFQIDSYQFIPREDEDAIFAKQ